MGAEYYTLIKSIHAGAAVLSIAGFLLRSVWMLTRNPLLHAKLTRILPHIVDTVLLIAAILLLIILGQAPWQIAWVSMKILLLLVYIVSGAMALKRAKGRANKIRWLLVAYASIAGILYFAVSKVNLW